MTEDTKQNKKDEFPSFSQIGYQTTDDGRLVAVNREAQRKYSEFMREEIARARALKLLPK